MRHRHEHSLSSFTNSRKHTHTHTHCMNCQATARARIISAAAAFPERADALLERATAVLLSTGCTTIDAMLGGGLRAGEFTEVFGTSASGKTQLCHQLAVIAAARGGSVVYAIPMTMLRSVSSCVSRPTMLSTKM